MVKPNRHDRRTIMSLYKKERKAIIKDLRKIKNLKHRAAEANQAVRYFHRTYPFFGADRFLADCGFTQISEGLVTVSESTTPTKESTTS